MLSSPREVEGAIEEQTMPDHDANTIFGELPRTREERSFSVSSSGHVSVNLRQLFESEEARRKLSRVARQVHSQSESSST
jgi:hypothetical protein